MTSPDLPIGGTTGCDHEHSEATELAARWLAEHRKTLSRPIVPELRDRFGLSIREAIDAACLAVKYEFLSGAGERQSCQPPGRARG